MKGRILKMIALFLAKRLQIQKRAGISARGAIQRAWEDIADHCDEGQPIRGWIRQRRSRWRASMVAVSP